MLHGYMLYLLMPESQYVKNMLEIGGIQISVKQSLERPWF
jgi:hypothetical protein